MKILHVTTHFYPFVGGLENLVLDITTEQAKKHEVIILTLKHQSDLPDYEELNGVKIYRHPAISLIKNRYLWPKFGFQKQIQSINPDVLFTHTRFFATSYFGQTTVGNWRKIHVEHGHNFVQSKNILIKNGAWLFDQSLGRKVMHKASAVVVLSRRGQVFVENFLKKSGQDSFQQRIKIIQNGTRNVQLLQSPPRSNKAIFFGRLIPEKGISEILYAAQKNPQWQFDFYGEGAIPEKFPDNVKFNGLIAPDKISAKIQTADLVVLPSWSEGASLAVLEAAANKRPILATPVGQNEKIISPEFLVPVRDEDALSVKISSLTNQFDELEIEGAKVQKVVQENYSFEKMIAQYEALLETK